MLYTKDARLSLMLLRVEIFRLGHWLFRRGPGDSSRHHPPRSRVRYAYPLDGYRPDSWFQARHPPTVEYTDVQALSPGPLQGDAHRTPIFCSNAKDKKAVFDSMSKAGRCPLCPASSHPVCCLFLSHLHS